jgi:lipopolysaccharide/colanic/teichoic acid biosynthesis glycosyltransferase
MDVTYIRNISFWLDLKIIALTLMSVVRRQGA